MVKPRTIIDISALYSAESVPQLSETEINKTCSILLISRNAANCMQAQL